MDEKLIIKKFIVRKLYRHRMWLHKHTNFNNLPKGLSNKLRVSKEVKNKIQIAHQKLNPKVLHDMLIKMKHDILKANRLAMESKQIQIY